MQAYIVHIDGARSRVIARWAMARRKRGEQGSLPGAKRPSSTGYADSYTSPSHGEAFKRQKGLPC